MTASELAERLREMRRGFRPLEEQLQPVLRAAADMLLAQGDALARYRLEVGRLWAVLAKAEAERDALRARIAAGTEGWAAIKVPTGCIAFVWSHRHQVWCLPSEYVGRVLILDDPETKPTQPACWPAPVAGEGGNE